MPGMRRTFGHEKLFARRMVRLRQTRGLTQQQLAGRAKMNRTAVAEIEGLSRHIRLNDAVALTAALGVTLEQMLSDEPLQINLEDR